MGSDVAQTLSLAAVEADADLMPPARRPRVLQYQSNNPGYLNRLFRSRGAWALCDQAVLSLGNFLTNLILANHLPPALYGIYGLVFGVILFLNSLHASVVTYPLTVRGAGTDQTELRKLTGRSLELTFALAPLLCIGLLFATASAHYLRVLPLAASALLLWQAQETLRRALMAQMRHAWAVPGDVLRYFGQPVAIWVLWRIGRLSPETAFAAIGASSGLAALVQAAQLRFIPGGWSAIWKTAVDCWKLGRWLLLTNLLTLATIYLTPWSLQASAGSAEVAHFYALTTIMGLTNPIFTSLGGLIVPAVAAARRQGPAEVRRVARNYGLLGAAMLLPIFAVLFAFPGFTLRMFFRSQPTYALLTTELRVMVACYTLFLAGQICMHILNGIEQGRATFIATLAGAIGNVAIVLPCALHYGLKGALWSGLAPVVAQAAAAGGLLWHGLNSRRRIER